MSNRSHYKDKINKNSPEPIYYQIYKLIREEIENEKYTSESFLPSENYFRMAFDVSKVTIRKSMGLLERDGYIRRERGRGTIVLDYRDTFYWSRLTSFTTYLTEQKVTSIIREFAIEKPNAKIKKLLNLDADDLVYKLVRVRLINNIRIALSTCYLTPHLPLKLTREMFDEYTSLFKLLTDNGLEIGTCDETVEAQIPTLEIKNILRMDKNTAVFYRERVTYDKDKNPFEFATIIYNADYYKYFIKSMVAEREKLLNKEG